jgi:hypothetical protein
MADSAFHIILRYGNHFAAVFFDHEIFDARALIARRHEQLRRYVGLIAKRQRIISIVYGRLWRLNSKPKVGRYLAATARAVEDGGCGENTNI